MAGLLGKQVGATLVEIHGPQNGVNYFADGTASVLVTPEVEIQVFGSGTVQFEENTSHILVGERASNIGGQQAYNTEKYADPAGWTPVGAVINSSSGLVTRAVTVGNPDPTWLRLRITVAGTGWVHLATKWG